MNGPPLYTPSHTDISASNLHQVLCIKNQVCLPKSHPCSDRDEIRVEVLVELGQVLLVLRVADKPIHRREMLALSQLLVQSPENLQKPSSQFRPVTASSSYANLHDTQRCGANRIREITTGGRHGAHNRDRAVPLRISEARHLRQKAIIYHPHAPTRTYRHIISTYLSSALVERGQARGKVCRIPLIGRHLCQTTGNLTERLSPS